MHCILIEGNCSSISCDITFACFHSRLFMKDTIHVPLAVEVIHQLEIIMQNMQFAKSQKCLICSIAKYHELVLHIDQEPTSVRKKMP